MFTNRNYNRFSILITLLILNYSCFCIAIESTNGTLAKDGQNFYPGVATWYGSPYGAGSGGACGMANDVANDPYYGMISAGNKNLFKSGAGCGTCYEVKCTDNPACSGYGVRVTITDECPGSCNNDAFHFDLSGKAFGSLAKPGQDNNLRSAGRINIQYRRVKCNYKSNVKFRIDSGSNRYYLALVVESLNGYGDIGYMELQPAGKYWIAMQRSYGVTWKADLKEGQTGPFSVRITGSENRTSITAYNVIPYDWRAGQYYYSNVNFQYLN